MNKQLYNFKIGDEVWHISEPGRYGVVHSVSQYDDTVWVRWTSLSIIAYTSGVRPKLLPKACRAPAGRLWHSPSANGK